MATSHFAVVVIGAGVQGISAAKTFTCLAPDLSLLVLDSFNSIGGVWAAEKLYPGLKTNNLHGTFEFTDFPMSEAEFGVKTDEHIPGKVVNRYLEAYVDKWGLREKIRLRSKVVQAEERGAEGWQLDVVEDGKKEYVITCDKLVISTGLTSVPMPIHIAGQESFGRPIFHSLDLAVKGRALAKDPEVQRVTIYGGSKSAYDAVYLFASAGKNVDWVVRASGHGAVYMSTPYIYVGPLRRWLEVLVMTRPLTFLSPCIWGDADGFRWVRSFFHETRFGRKIVKLFWNTLSSDTLAQNGLLDGNKDLKKLVPDESLLWYGANTSILNYPTDIHDFVRSGQVKVERKDVSSLGPDGTINFADGQQAKTDALVTITGWKFDLPLKILPDEKLASWGIPSTTYSKSQKETWDKLHQEADVEILERFPMLASGPQVNRTSMKANRLDVAPAGEVVVEAKDEVYAPWRLWRGIAPPGQVADGYRNLVFPGMSLSLQTSLRCEISSLWCYAYLTNQLDGPLDTLSRKGNATMMEINNKAEQGTIKANNLQVDVMYDTALFGRFGKWRSPYGQGSRFPDVVFDGLPYLDFLLRDLGLNRWRKGWSWIGEIFGGSYHLADFKDLDQEWLAKRAALKQT